MKSNIENRAANIFGMTEEESSELLARLMTGSNGVASGLIEPIQNLNPHYTVPYYKKPRTVFLASGYTTAKDQFGHEWVEKATYQYSDRLTQGDNEKHHKAWGIADTYQPHRTGGFYQRYLGEYFEKPDLKLVHILAAFNVSNGYPYQVFGYII